MNYYISDPHSNADSGACQEQIRLSAFVTPPQEKVPPRWKKQDAVPTLENKKTLKLKVPFPKSHLESFMIFQTDDMTQIFFKK